MDGLGFRILRVQAVVGPHANGGTQRGRDLTWKMATKEEVEAAAIALFLKIDLDETVAKQVSSA